ncbi:hypothetical protein LPJ62_002426 [Coemansia sp. RSA 2167]|nr:hypothetical protein LPJ62_002426 [Coemansia sp. RSA 2167]
MSDYSAWSQLFRLNPDTPQTPMLSTQELQDELALWGNAQFQLEGEEAKAKAESRKSSLGEQGWAMGQVNPLSFMMDGSELLNAIAPSGQQPWALNGVPMLPLAPLAQQQTTSQQQQQTSQKQTPKGPKVVPIAPAPTTHTQQSPMTLASKSSDDSAEPEDESRAVAADEDKRRRNTAASARLRVKKKLKEQALEQTAREMTVKAEALEKRVHELETETRWLKSLITERDPNVLGSVQCPCHHPEGLEPSSKRPRT